MKFALFSLFLAAGISVQAQVHLGKSTDDLISTLGDDYTKVSDQDGNEVLAYFNEIKDHPKYGDFTLYTTYLCENHVCVMQQTAMPVSQMSEVVEGFNSRFQKVDDFVWKSKEGDYYALAKENGMLHLKITSGNIYNRKQN